MRIVVTGSSGLVGAILMERLQNRGDDPVPVDIRDKSGPVDILDAEALGRTFAGADGVVHLAAVSRVAWGESHPDLCDSINVLGTARVLEAARAAGADCWCVHASSREIYGDAPVSPVTEDAPKNPVNRYGQSKLTSETLVNDAAEAGMRTAILRLSSVYGGRQDHPDRVVPSLTWRALQGEQLVITGADTFFDFVHVEDTVDGIIAAIDRLASQEGSLPPLNLATGVATSLQDLAEIVLSATGSQAALNVAPARSFDVSGYCGSTERAEQVLGWKARRDLRGGVRGLAEDFARSGPLEIVTPPA